MDKLLELLEKLVRAIFGPGDEQDMGEPEPTPQSPKAETIGTVIQFFFDRMKAALKK